jgi:predicted ArsR family transcriptional regulator
MSRGELTELQRRCIAFVDRIGGDVTVKQVAEAVGGKLETVREELRAMSAHGLIFMTKGAGGRYTVSTRRSSVPKESADVAKSRTLVNASSSDGYDGADLRPVPGLPESRLAWFSMPSRIGNRLHYQDGRVEVIE